MRLNLRSFFKKNIKIILSTGLLFGIIIFLLGFRLTGVAPTLQAEQARVNSLRSSQSIISDVSSAGEYLVVRTAGFDAINLRYYSIGLGLLSAIILFVLLRKWHTRRVAWATTILYGASAYFLAISRSGLSDAAMLAALPLLLLAGTWLRRKKDIVKLPIATLICTLLLYLPGLWLFLLSGVVALRKRIGLAFKLNSKLVVAVSLGTLLIGLFPLVYVFSKNPSQMFAWLTLLDSLSIDLKSLANNFIGIFDVLFYRGFDDRTFWLTGSAILDVIAMAFIALGIYSYRVGLHPMRKRVLYGFSILSLIVITIGGTSLMPLFIPLLYIFAANGIAFLLQQWFTVFPRNPLARTTGILFLSLLVLFSCFYQVRKYFVAWPNSPDTISAQRAEKL